MSCGGPFVGHEKGVREPIQIILRRVHEPVRDNRFEAPMIFQKHGDGHALSTRKREDLANGVMLAIVLLGPDGSRWDLGFAPEHSYREGICPQREHLLEVRAVCVECGL
jgi:hypothetical protein